MVGWDGLFIDENYKNKTEQTPSAPHSSGRVWTLSYGNEMKSLPKFTYFRDPYTSDLIYQSKESCVCCQSNEGYVFEHASGLICPWCIHTGRAALDLKLTFNDTNNCPSAISTSILNELSTRTPSFPSWQDSTWQFHCDDACVFDGDLPLEEANNPNENAVIDLMTGFGLPVETAKEGWLEMIQNYEIASSSIFKFSCRHCDSVFYTIDSP